ncbi:unnamed protein product [Caretta caretta]
MNAFATPAEREQGSGDALRDGYCCCDVGNRDTSGGDNKSDNRGSEPGKLPHSTEKLERANKKTQAPSRKGSNSRMIIEMSAGNLAMMGSESQQSEEGRGESKVMVKREAKAPDFVCRFCYNCCPGNPGFGLCCSS